MALWRNWFYGLCDCLRGFKLIVPLVSLALKIILDLRNVSSDKYKPQLSRTERLEVMASYALTHNFSETARAFGVSANTVRSIIQREQTLADPNAIDRIKKRMASKFLLAADYGADRVAELLPECTNVQQVSVATAVMFDKYRLATDQSTENVSKHVFLDLVNSVPVDADFDKVIEAKAADDAVSDELDEFESAAKGGGGD
jgi:hypothetical protein